MKAVKILNDLKNSPDSFMQGIGLGLRAEHFKHITTHWPDIPWFEVLADNYFLTGGVSLSFLKKIAERYPVVLHSVGMSIGSTDPINVDYFNKLKKLKSHIGAKFCSDHLCFSSVDNQYVPDLFPLPLAEQVIKHVVARIKEIQERLGSRILIENVSSYVTFKSDSLTEWEFLNTIAEQADCYILLDINNIYVSATNNKFSPEEYLNAITPARVKQFHLAGFKDCGDYLLDNHGVKVESHVVDLYKKALIRFGNVPACVEWDNDIPEFAVLQQEQQKFTNILNDYLIDAEKNNNHDPKIVPEYSEKTKKDPLANLSKNINVINPKVTNPKINFNLHDLQHEFINSIYQPKSEKTTLENINMSIEEAHRRFQIYRASTFGGLIIACSQVYQVVKELIGKNCFEKLIEEYAQENIPHSPNLNEFAQGLPKFIESFSLLKQIKYLSDVAALESLRNLLFNIDAKKSSVNVIEKLSALPEAKQAKAIFKLDDNLHVIKSDYPILDIWKFHQSAHVDKTLNLSEAGQNVAMWKDNTDVLMLAIPEQMCYAIEIIKNKAPFYELVTRIVAKYPDYDATQILPQCLQMGWVKDLKI